MLSLGSSSQTPQDPCSELLVSWDSWTEVNMGQWLG